MSELEAVVRDIRASTPRHPDEDLTQWHARTYHAALLLIEQTREELPNVKAVREQSVRASIRAGKPEQKKDEE